MSDTYIEGGTMDVCCVKIERPADYPATIVSICDQKPEWNITVYSENLDTGRKYHRVYPTCHDHSTAQVQWFMEQDETRQVTATWRGAYE